MLLCSSDRESCSVLHPSYVRWGQTRAFSFTIHHSVGLEGHWWWYLTYGLKGQRADEKVTAWKGTPNKLANLRSKDRIKGIEPHEQIRDAGGGEIESRWWRCGSREKFQGFVWVLMMGILIQFSHTHLYHCAKYFYREAGGNLYPTSAKWSLSHHKPIFTIKWGLPSDPTYQSKSNTFFKTVVWIIRKSFPLFPFVTSCFRLLHILDSFSCFGIA